MSLWLSNIPILLQSLRENDWYITAFPFSFNGHDYVVVFEDLRELARGSKYYSVNLTFILCVYLLKYIIFISVSVVK